MQPVDSDTVMSCFCLGFPFCMYFLKFANFLGFTAQFSLIPTHLLQLHNRMRELRGHEVPHGGLNWLEQQHDVCTRDNYVPVFDFSSLLTKRIAQVRNISKKLAQVELLETLIYGYFVGSSVFAGPLLSKGAAFIDWERSSIGLPSLDCANWEIGRGPFGDRFFGTCSIKEKKLRNGMFTHFGNPF